jgi:hypothetical protein
MEGELVERDGCTAGCRGLPGEVRKDRFSLLRWAYDFGFALRAELAAQPGDSACDRGSVVMGPGAGQAVRPARWTCRRGCSRRGESYYEVEVVLPDGRQVDVQLDEQFHVVGTDGDK